MTLADALARRIRRADDAQADMPDWIEAIANEDEPGLHTFLGYWHQLTLAIIVTPQDTRRFSRVASMLERVIAQESENAAESLNSTHVSALDLVNTFACAGLPFSETTWTTLRGWLPRIVVTRNDEFTGAFWNRGLAALCLGDRTLYRWYAGVRDDEALPVPAGETYGPNVRGAIAAFTAAVEHGASADTVAPALHDLLDHFDHLYGARMIDESTLLWAARVVHHHLGEASLGSVAQWFHDLAWRRAGIAP